MNSVHKKNDREVSRGRYVLAGLVVFLIIIGSGLIYLREEKNAAIKEAGLDLSLIVELKASQLVQWRKERLLAANAVSSNPMIAHRICDYLKHVDSKSAYEEIRSWLNGQLNVSGQRGLYLFRPDGTAIASVSDRQGAVPPHYRDLVASVIKSRQVALSDFRFGSDTGTVSLDLSVPLVGTDSGDGECNAVMIIDIDPYLALYPLIRFWPTPSRTGETVLVRKDGNDALVLNELRDRPESAGGLRIPLSESTLLESVAATGREGVIPGKDCRGRDALAAVRVVPGTSWVMLAKVDISEVLEPVIERVWYVVALGVVLMAVVMLSVSLWWRRKREALLFSQYESELRYNSELKQAEQALLESNNRLEERVERRTEELSSAVLRLRQEVAERKQVEELLRKQFQAILQSPVAIVITGLDGIIEFVNPKFTEYSGYTYEEAIGQNPRILKAGVTPPEFYRNLWDTIVSGNVWEGELCNRRKNGEVYWEYSKILPVKNQDGEITNYMAFKEDITRQKLLEEKLVRSRKLKTIGQIAGGVAHEVRNPLNAILSITEALFKEKEIEENPEFEPYIQHIRTQVNRLAHLMNELLDLGKNIPTSSINPVPLSEVCREAVELWSSSGTRGRETVLITEDEEQAHCPVMADRGRFIQIIINLLENAAQHSPENSRIRLEIRYDEENRAYPGLASVRIVDSGTGIPPDRLPRVFDPFYTARKGGVGLGLALVKHFIEDMSGAVILSNNTPLPGCTAEIHIPKAVEKNY